MKSATSQQIHEEIDETKSMEERGRRHAWAIIPFSTTTYLVEA